MIKNHKKLLCFILLTVFLCLQQAVSFAGQKVRVGYSPYMKTYSEGGPDIPRNGYGYEYLQQLASYTGWEYEYVYGTWPELYEKLKAGEIDILGQVTPTSTPEPNLLFSRYAAGYNHFSLYVNNTWQSPALDAEDLRILNGKRIACFAGQYEYDLLQKWLKKNNIHAEIVRLPNHLETRQALSDGTVDAILEIDFLAPENSHFFTNIGRANFYFAVNSKNENLLKSLNNAQKKIYELEPYYNAYLAAKYNKGTEKKVRLTKKEATWLAGHPSLKIGTLNEYKTPSESQNVVSALLNKVFTNVNVPGTKLEYSYYDNISAMLTDLNKGKLDAIYPYLGTPNQSEMQKVFSSRTVVNSTFNLVINGTNLHGPLNSIAVVSNKKFDLAYVDKHFPDAKKTHFNDNYSALKAVADGKVQAAVMRSYTFRVLLKEHPEFYTLSTLLVPETIPLSVAVSRKNPTLLHIIDKGLHSINADELHQMVFLSQALTEKPTFKNFIYNHIAASITLAFIFAMMIIAFIVVQYNNRKEKAHNHMLNLINKELEEKNKTLGSVAAVYNSMHIIDLTTDTFESYMTTQHILDNSSGNNNASQQIKTILKNLAAESYRERVVEFVDLTTIAERLRGNSQLSIEFYSVYNHWVRCKVIPLNLDATGKSLKIVFTSEFFDEMKQREEMLYVLSHSDKLTMLNNRLAQEEDIKRINEIGLTDNFKLIVLDVNGLKTINDTLGHVAGDELIMGAAKCITETFSRFGKCYRMGGDEFIVMAYMSEEQLMQSLKNFESLLSNWKGNLVKQLHIAYGVVSAHEYPDATIEELMRLADDKMYTNKAKYYEQTGINRRKK